jgi:hypothetical protein
MPARFRFTRVFVEVEGRIIADLPGAGRFPDVEPERMGSLSFHAINDGDAEDIPTLEIRMDGVVDTKSLILSIRPGVTFGVGFPLTPMMLYLRVNNRLVFRFLDPTGGAYDQLVFERLPEQGVIVVSSGAGVAPTPPPQPLPPVPPPDRCFPDPRLVAGRPDIICIEPAVKPLSWPLPCKCINRDIPEQLTLTLSVTVVGGMPPITLDASLAVNGRPVMTLQRQLTAERSVTIPFQGVAQHLVEGANTIEMWVTARDAVGRVASGTGRTTVTVTRPMQVTGV